MSLWHRITSNEDGTPLLGAVWAGPLFIGAAVVSVVRSLFL